MAVTASRSAFRGRTTRGRLGLALSARDPQPLYQVIIAVSLLASIWYIVSNTVTNLRKQNIASGFGFWDTTYRL